MGEIAVRQAFEVAMRAEKTAERLYQGLAEKFIEHAEIVAFCLQYAADEIKHAGWLLDLKIRLNEDQLAKPVDADTLNLLQAVSQFSLEQALSSVNDLEDAYQLIDEVENGETNAIFQFLMNNFESNAQIRMFLREQLAKHVARLATDLPAQYLETAARRAVKTRELQCHEPA
jgi:hypothetical protein